MTGLACGRVLLALAALILGGCATLGPQQREAAAGIAIAARSTQVDCTQADACALASPLRALGERALAESTPDAPSHHALILDRGPDALLARIHMNEGNTALVVPLLETYIRSNPDDGLALSLLGSAYMSQGKAARATQFLQGAVIEGQAGHGQIGRWLQK